jgi:putative DNA primase/helicase
MNTTTDPPPFPFMTPADRLAIATRCAGAVRLTDIQPTPVQWLWPGRIPLGYVTLLVADPGVGKSLLALDIAARVSTGAPWPDANDEARMTNDELPSHSSFDIRHSSFTNPQSEIRNPKSSISPSSVLLLNIEDHFATTVRPRLEALGADCSRILGLSHVPGQGVLTMPRPVAINRDLNRLEMLIRELADCRLIILDPITAFFGDTSTRSTGNIWMVLSNLAWLAASANLAVLAISHLRKKEGPAIHRTLGSLAFIAAARAAWTIATDPANAGQRLFLPLKNNLAESAHGLAFTIESQGANRAPVIRWLPGVVEHKADMAVAPTRSRGRPDDELQRAVRWLSQHLAHGRSPTNEVRKAADANGVAYRTLRRAFCEIGAQAIQRGLGHNRRWFWELPGSDVQ